MKELNSKSQYESHSFVSLYYAHCLEYEDQCSIQTTDRSQYHKSSKEVL